ncbi:phosphoribosylformylglycinamidine synthase [bacterium (Candidatus Gribaldobacteria) CG_4_8_14_3_um_filter_42_11]|uniref:Phosphoribosylformylglycinamidine synthase n=1 Tax=bacterium (Candidatus Gribaldobacteria) CG_4_8_14_3_um_filter_42_11 TaxID=2014267 RepID=A0A2M7IXA2_9BACT|nr:MAG: phosphoribosylformylglycinamidine synthase [bacterium (Candidatus Gribaldobacteria) CG_4_8_14_3_um_filter_42_11]
MEILRFYRRVSAGLEYCFNVQAPRALTEVELKILNWLLAETFEPENFSSKPFITGRRVIEVGPRMNFATPWNTNALSAFRSCGISNVVRIERSRRYKVPEGVGREEFIRSHHDRMTECVYEKPLTTFNTGIIPEVVYTIPLIKEGPEALAKIPGISMDEFDRQMYYDYFVKKRGRNPTIVEIMDLNNANSEHSRHGYFKSIQVIDGTVMPKTLMEMVKLTLLAGGSNSVLAFCDNSSAIKGYEVLIITPRRPGSCSDFVPRHVTFNILFTAETHNFPSGVAPMPGAETGTGGRIRDGQATGRGSLVIAGTAGYCVGNLLIPGYELPWEDKSLVYPDNLASPLQIELEASNGASDYGNKFGEPVIQGFTRSFGMRLPNGERREWLKPIMFTGGIGQIDERHLKKGEAETGMCIVQIGGPAYRIGFGGGAASSMLQGENKAELDFNAVQRGDAEMEQKMNRVVRACVEMGDNNPIVSIHDQGAGGPANVLKELVEKAGGRIDLRKINSGDPTLSVLEIWVCEFQERNGLLIRPKYLDAFQQICDLEKVACEVLGEVTGDGKFTVYDSDGSTPVDLDLADVLGNMPQKTFSDTRVEPVLKPLELPADLTVRQALERVLRLLSVGSKRFLTNKVDRSVTGLIAQQQCVGPLQLPLADVAVVAQSHFGLTGAATAIGERPNLGVISPAAQGRMTVAEMLMNMVWARISSLSDIKCSANWMWAPKLPGEGARLYDTVKAMCGIMDEIGVDGGKDSLSMATKVPLPDGSVETVKSPGQLVLSGYCTMPDISKVVTPEFKRSGTRLIFMDLAEGKRRLGGSALAQAYGQVGDECPDVEDSALLANAFRAIQEMINRDLILSGHDISDGGLLITLLEMAFAGNRGFSVYCQEDIFNWFSEEAGCVIEYELNKTMEVSLFLGERGIPHQLFGMTLDSEMVQISGFGGFLFEDNLCLLRRLWEETSKQLDLQTKFSKINPVCVKREYDNIYQRSGPQYQLSFTPKPTPDKWLCASSKPKVAIIREEGSNGDREMTAMFHQAGFECWDVAMTHLLSGQVMLEMFRGIVFVGGFSYADVLDSAKGWAGVILFNEKLKKQFDEFYVRPDTFSLGVCNGCQLMALLGWVPWRCMPDVFQPRFIRNESERFESRWATVRIFDSPAIMLKGMADSVLGIWVAHGEGRVHFPDPVTFASIGELSPIRFVDDQGKLTEDYPFNPNGSVNGITSLCSRDGRHLAMMPHPERAFLKWQWPWMPEEWRKMLTASPWFKMSQNAREWCDK